MCDRFRVRPGFGLGKEPAAIDPLSAIGLVDDEDIVLDRAALLLAAADRQEASAELAAATGYLEALLVRLKAAARQHAGDTPAAHADALVTLLADSEGFSGDEDDYDAPENSDLLAVLRRRRGIPISLSILYVSLARAMGWRADILGLPGHVLVAIGSRAGHVLVDPFADGRPVDARGVKAIVVRALGRQTTVTAAHVEPLGNRAILVRLLMNQASRARRSGDAPRALTLYRRMTLVAPDRSSLWWERARLERLAGDIDAARRSLAAMRETTHDPIVAGRIRAAVEALAR